MARLRRLLVLMLSVLVLVSGAPVQGVAVAGNAGGGRMVLAAQTTQGTGEREKTVRKRLLRDTKHAKIGGVCAGIANYFDLDPTLVRLGWVLFVLMGGAGIVGYIICWIVIPPA